MLVCIFSELINVAGAFNWVPIKLGWNNNFSPCLSMSLNRTSPGWAPTSFIDFLPDFITAKAPTVQRCLENMEDELAERMVQDCELNNFSRDSEIYRNLKDTTAVKCPDS
nr:uncharacterized protein CTRU02_05687 [Colletotrichum truncatum]KAF6794130.1 hypothetical protein CTRU02_05687 [Colletotrichum truncatum]